MSIENREMRMYFSISLLRAEDAEQTIDCMSDVFCREPMTRSMQITPAIYRPFAEIICQRAVADGLSVVAKERGRPDVLGFCIAEDFHRDAPDLSGIDARFRPILELLAELDDRYKARHAVKEGEICHLFMLGIRQQYAGQGIARQISDANIELVQQKGFRGLILEATGMISQHIARKSGFEEVDQIEYQSYSYQGQKVFQHLEAIQSCLLMRRFF